MNAQIESPRGVSYWAVGLEIPEHHTRVVIAVLGDGKFELHDHLCCFCHPDLETAATAREASAICTRLLGLVQATLLLQRDLPIEWRFSGHVFRVHADGGMDRSLLVEVGKLEIRGFPPAVTINGQPKSPELLSQKIASLRDRNSHYAEAIELFSTSGNDGKVLRQILDIVRYAHGLRKFKDAQLAARIHDLFGVETIEFLHFKDTADNRWVHLRSKLKYGVQVSLQEGQQVIAKILTAWLDRDA
ncbi:MAG TPA: hypothetical protein VIO94_07085 [Phenylobacterium sp.]